MMQDKCEPRTVRVYCAHCAEVISVPEGLAKAFPKKILCEPCYAHLTARLFDRAARVTTSPD